MTEQKTKAAAEPPLDCRVGRCCYGGMKTMAACGSCAAWQEATDFAAALAAQQVPLEREFAEVLHTNLWDLYESDDTVPNAK